MNAAIDRPPDHRHDRRPARTRWASTTLPSTTAVWMLTSMPMTSSRSMNAMNGASHQSVMTRRGEHEPLERDGHVHEREQQAQRERDLDEGEEDPRQPDDEHAASVGTAPRWRRPVRSPGCESGRDGVGQRLAAQTRRRGCARPCSPSGRASARWPTRCGARSGSSAARRSGWSARMRLGVGHVQARAEQVPRAQRVGQGRPGRRPGPATVLTRTAPGFIRASAAASIRWRVSALRLTWTLTKSLWREQLVQRHARRRSSGSTASSARDGRSW